ncbi:MAG: FAD-dependent oxidoreductase [bacterium]|nr:FAD-dependent oxidoreductase [bacterium]
MEQFKYLIIGGGVSGTTAAETIRKGDVSGSIAIVSDEPHRFYSRIMLSKPNFFLGKIPFESVWLRAQDWYVKSNVVFMAGRTAIELDPAKKTVTLDNGAVACYEKLLLAFGTKPNIWPSDDANKDGVFYLRTLDDARGVMTALKSAKKVAVVGGGFVGFEMCDLVRMAGLPVTFLIREKYFWDYIWDESSGRMVEAALDRGGVDLMLGVTVQEILGKGKVSGVRLSDGRTIDCDMLFIGIGVNYPLNWLRECGLQIGRGILANEFLETNLPEVWAAGDVAEYQDVVLNERVIMGNWANAQEQGRAAGANMIGAKKPFRLVSFYTTVGFGTTIAFVGDIFPKEGRDIVYRGSPEINSYARLLVAGNKLIGATMVNRTVELSSFAKIIDKGLDISDKIGILDDPNHDLKEIVKDL